MNHAQRRKVGKVLRAFRRKTGKTCEQMNAALGWPASTYEGAELGEIGLSKGQQNDVRRLMAAETKAAGIRDALSARSSRRPARRML